MDFPLWLWFAFTAFVIVLLAIDLGIFHREAHVVGFREAAVWSVIWIALALLFNLYIFLAYGKQAGLEFLTGYLVEKSLSLDNVFVWMVIFSYFAVPAQYQHRVLFYGILGAIVFRGLFIATGVTLLNLFHWVVYVFGALLIFTGIRLAVRQEEEVHPERNPLVRLTRRIFPMTSGYHGQKFFVRAGKRLMATPLLLVLVVVESTDVLFAVDSIPAILAITRDPFIVWTSNVFAILGLRALFFLLAGVLGIFVHLHYGLAAILVFVGIKMVLSEFYKIPIGISLGVVAGILLVTILVSLLVPGGVRRPLQPADVRTNPGHKRPEEEGPAPGV